MEILFRVKRAIKAICTQNTGLIKDVIKVQYCRYAGEVDNLFPSHIRL
jgi:hypothetical protein